MNAAEGLITPVIFCGTSLFLFGKRKGGASEKQKLFYGVV